MTPAAHHVAGEPQRNPTGDIHEVFLLALWLLGQSSGPASW
jgi:hypothetical protein